MSHDLPHASFHHPSGAWYRLWITRTEPKTERGHAWHLHASFDRTGTIAPVAGTNWYELPYGMKNWDYDSRDEAHAAFLTRARERLRHGYAVREGSVPGDASPASG